MRNVSVLLAMLLLSACADRPTFDERFDQKAEELNEKAKALDANLSNDADSASTNDTGS